MKNPDKTIPYNAVEIVAAEIIDRMLCIQPTIEYSKWELTAIISDILRKQDLEVLKRFNALRNNGHCPNKFYETVKNNIIIIELIRKKINVSKTCIIEAFGRAWLRPIIENPNKTDNYFIVEDSRQRNIPLVIKAMGPFTKPLATNLSHLFQAHHNEFEIADAALDPKINIHNFLAVVKPPKVIMNYFSVLLNLQEVMPLRELLGHIDSFCNPAKFRFPNNSNRQEKEQWLSQNRATIIDAIRKQNNQIHIDKLLKAYLNETYGYLEDQYLDFKPVINWSYLEHPLNYTEASYTKLINGKLTLLRYQLKEIESDYRVYSSNHLLDKFGFSFWDSAIYHLLLSNNIDVFGQNVWASKRDAVEIEDDRDALYLTAAAREKRIPTLHFSLIVTFLKKLSHQMKGFNHDLEPYSDYAFLFETFTEIREQQTKNHAFTCNEYENISLLQSVE